MIKILRNLLGSIAFKFALALAALAAMVAAAVLVASSAFLRIDTQFTDLVGNQVTDLRTGSEVIARADRLKDGLTAILLAKDPSGLSAGTAEVDNLIAGTKDIVSELPAASSEAFLTLLEDVRRGIGDLSAARAEEFRTQAELQAMAEVLNTATDQAGRLLLTLADEAAFNLEIGAEDKVNVLDQTLSQLVDVDFAYIQILLKIRSEINLLSGALIASNETQDSGLKPILNDLAVAAATHADALLAEARGLGLPEEAAAPITEAITFYNDVLGGRRFSAQTFRDTALGHRQTIDAALAEMIDDRIFSLVISAETASQGNRTAIQDLLENQLGQLRMVSTLDNAVKSFSIAAFQGALAQDEAALAIANDRLASAADRLRNLSTDAASDVQTVIADLLPAADTEKGIISLRRSQIAARAAAAEISRSAAESVLEIATQARESGHRTVQGISAAGDVIGAQIEAARVRMQAITYGCVAIVLGTLLFVLSFIVRPLIAVSRATERLASGDLAPLDGVARASGEVARMVGALRIFRDNLIETKRMQEEEAARDKAQKEAESRAEADRRARDEKDRAMAEQQERERAEMKAAQEAEREAHRRAAEAERQKTEEAQKRVVSALADALESLAAGALDVRIATGFPDGYEQLRLNFNDAIAALERTIVSVSRSGQTIFGNAAEITSAADDLSQRTEASAATLEETAAALAELTSAVRDAAGGASEADTIVRRARSNAESNEAVVRKTIAAMAEIEKSSQSISRIIDVIEDIAFQTNLLALNAGVEAARAGESGRGFAVVATEVRSLAQRSADAAHEIGALIRESSDQVNRGVTLVGQTGSALQTIMSGFTEVSTYVSKIAEAANEQSGKIAEINRAVEQLDRVTQQNAAMFEEMTAASHSLNREVSELADMLGVFRVSEEHVDEDSAPGGHLRLSA